MKNLIFLIIFSISTNLFAQPGYLPHMQEADFKRITEQLNDDPNNYELIWQRLNINSSHFDIYSKGGIVKKENVLNEPEAISLSNWTYEERIADLNKLIESKAEINEYGTISNIADFTFMRGQIYYLLGEYQKALTDYLFALDNINENEAKRNNYYKKQKICISIAAYYYNKREDNEDYYKTSTSEENLRQALKYIDMISPLEFTENFNDENSYNYYESIQDSYEQEKINLLTYLKEDVRLENYYKKLMRNQYEIFKRQKARDDEWDKDDVKKNGYNYSTNSSYLNALGYANRLANFYYDRKNYKKAKWLAEQTINYFPTNSFGYIVDRYDVGIHYLLLNKIYQTEGFKNFDKEMNTLIDLLGGSTHGTNYNVSEIGKYLNERLQENPNEPRLYLALGIWHYKNRMSSSHSATLSTAEILNLLNKAEKLKLKDYRLPFAKAAVYLHLEKNNELGLSEINKALNQYKANPSVYSIKYELLRKFPNPNEQELQELNGENMRKYRVKNYKDMSNFLKEIEK